MVQLILFEEITTQDEIEAYAFGLLEELDELAIIHDDLVIEYTVALSLMAEEWAEEAYQKGCDVFDRAVAINQELDALEAEYEAL